MSKIKDDGYEDLEIEQADGAKTVVRLDSYLLGVQLVEAAREHKASDGKESEWIARVRSILEANKITGLSSKACLDAADAIRDAMGDSEKKSEATPPVE